MELIFNMYFLISCLLIVAYVFIMFQYIQGWKGLPTWEVPENYSPKTIVSIIIAARNEEENILPCLQSIIAQTYPTHLWEVIVVNDHSTDKTADLVTHFSHQNVKLLHLADFIKPEETNAYKKKAIEVGITMAIGDLIVTTDADCIVQSNWLMLLASYFECKDMKFIAAPVNFYREQNTLERFQSLDFMGMMGIAGGGIQRGFMRMCNGANLAYPKSIFQEVNGFQGITHLASGDDMLLMHKVAAKYPTRVGYLKNKAATTYTFAKPTFQSFLQQRIRWATKSSSYRERMVTIILASVLFFCMNIVVSLILLPFVGWQIGFIFLSSLIVKAIMDYWFLGSMSHFFQRQDLMRAFLPSFFMHIAYIVFVGTVANLVKKYEWKGRQVR